MTGMQPGLHSVNIVKNFLIMQERGLRSVHSKRANLLVPNVLFIVIVQL